MNKKWTKNQIPDLTGKVIIVTGGNSGLGYEACKLYTQHKAQVIMASRNLDRCHVAKSKILKRNPNAKIDIIQLDLANLRSIEQFVYNFKKKYTKLDILLNNAGVILTPEMKTADGFEYQNGINHLGHFALTARLFPMIKQTKNSRIVNVSSLGHRFDTIDWDNYMFQQKTGSYNSRLSYGRSKLSNLLFTYELDRRIREAKLDIKVLAAHPGISNTHLGHFISKKWWYYLAYPLIPILLQSAARGTLPEVRASVDESAQSGEFYGPRGIGETFGLPVIVKSNEASHSLEDAKKLWEASESLTQLTFKI